MESQNFSIQCKNKKVVNIINIFSRETYGYRRIYHELREKGIVCSHHRIARLMRQADLRVKSRRPYKITTRTNPRHLVADNLLDRDFQANQPDRKWVTDITHIATDQSWLYLATVMDLFSRRIVGWSMQPRMKIDLVADALKMALARRRPDTGLLQIVAASSPVPTNRNCWRRMAFR